MSKIYTTVGDGKPFCCRVCGSPEYEDHWLEEVVSAVSTDTDGNVESSTVFPDGGYKCRNCSVVFVSAEKFTSPPPA